MKAEQLNYLLFLVPMAPLIASLVAAVVYASAERANTMRLQYWAIIVSLFGTAVALTAHLVIVFAHPPLIGESSATVITPSDWFLINSSLRLEWAFRYDALTSIMAAVVLFVGLMVQVFSVGYLADRKHDYARYFSLISFFLFSMLLLVTAANMLVFFVGWELVGVSSYKLISFYIEKDAAQRAGKKAFIINRIGDAALLIAMFAIMRVANTLDFRELAKAFAPGSVAATHANFIGLMVFIAAAAKSAQIPLYTWLPDAMTGPTPVSALIHAATMVTAGIFLMLRLEPIFILAPDASLIVAHVGALTAFVAAFIAVAQTDIKKVLAYSTVSQLGLMVLAVGTGAYSAAFFHLFTHAFFKAMLFLSAGAVITYQHHEQNIRRMGGLAKKYPLLALLFWVALAALSGLPGLSGFFSKDHILAAAFALKSGGGIAGALALAASLLTAFYSFRLGIIVFHGKPAESAHTHSTEDNPQPSVSFYLPLILLAIPSVVAGWVGVPAIFTESEPAFMEFIGRNLPAAFAAFVNSMQHRLTHAMELQVVAGGIAVAVVGAGAAIYYYGIRGRRPVAEGAYHAALTKLSFMKLYVDEIYDFIFATPYRKISDRLAAFDARTLPAISDGLAEFAETVGAYFARLQDGVIAHYAMYFVAGVLAILFLLVGKG
ncbi:MAG: NADH-quinone oxidoreductase subunit L [Spirochaetes bacterium]|nr:NADH-quinone oxidoreductase subunit L [Spirochaetota bacterium]